MGSKYPCCTAYECRVWELDVRNAAVIKFQELCLRQFLLSLHKVCQRLRRIAFRFHCCYQDSESLKGQLVSQLPNNIDSISSKFLWCDEFLAIMCMGQHNTRLQFFLFSFSSRVSSFSFILFFSSFAFNSVRYILLSIQNYTYLLSELKQSPYSLSCFFQTSVSTKTAYYFGRMVPFSAHKFSQSPYRCFWIHKGWMSTNDMLISYWVHS